MPTGAPAIYLALDRRAADRADHDVERIDGPVAGHGGPGGSHVAMFAGTGERFAAAPATRAVFWAALSSPLAMPHGETTGLGSGEQFSAGKAAVADGRVDRWRHEPVDGHGSDRAECDGR